MYILIILGIVSIIVLVTLLELRRNRKTREEYNGFRIIVGHYNWLYKVGLCETAEHFNELNFYIRNI